MYKVRTWHYRERKRWLCPDRFPTIGAAREWAEDFCRNAVMECIPKAYAQILAADDTVLVELTAKWRCLHTIDTVIRNYVTRMEAQ